MVCELYLNKALYTHIQTHTTCKRAAFSLSLMQKPLVVGHSPPSCTPGRHRSQLSSCYKNQVQLSLMSFSFYLFETKKNPLKLPLAHHTLTAHQKILAKINLRNTINQSSPSVDTLSFGEYRIHTFHTGLFQMKLLYSGFNLGGASSTLCKIYSLQLGKSHGDHLLGLSLFPANTGHRHASLQKVSALHCISFHDILLAVPQRCSPPERWSSSLSKFVQTKPRDINQVWIGQSKSVHTCL